MFGDREITKRVDLKAVIGEDEVVEGDETIELTVALATGAPVGASIGARASAVLTIVDNDVAGSFQFTQKEFQMKEDGTPVVAVTITRTGGSGGTVSVVVTPSEEPNGGAVAGKDFKAEPVTVTFGPGNLNRQVQIPIINDTFVEHSETLRLTLSLAGGNPASTTLGTLKSAILTIVDEDPNHAPVAKDDGLTAKQGSLTTFEAKTLLANDTDADPEDVLTVVKAGPRSSQGAAVGVFEGQVFYSPPLRFIGEDRFTYTVSDSFGASTEASVMVRVEAVNSVPVAREDVVVIRTKAGQDVVIDSLDLLRNDLDIDSNSTLKVGAVDPVSKLGGTVQLRGSNAGTQSLLVFLGGERWTNKLVSAQIIYRPSAVLGGVDEFRYTVVDEQGAAGVSTVRLIMNTPPTIKAVSEQTTVAGRASTPVKLEVGDIETDAPSLSVRVASSDPGLLPPQSLSVVQNAAGRVLVITPPKSASGTATVTVTVTDAQGDQASTSFGVVVKPGSKGGLVDLDGDSKIDLLLQHDEGFVGLWSLDGEGKVLNSQFLTPASVGDIQWSLSAASDLDKDGDSDLIFKHADGTLAFWKMAGTELVESGLLSPDNTGDQGWRVAGSEDLDGDSSGDLVFQHTDGSIGVWFMEGTQRKGSALTSPSDPGDVGWKVVGVGDFDRDGRNDLLFQYKDGTIAAWLMDGVTLRESRFLSPANPGTGWSVRSVADVDADGQPDIIFEHTSGLAAVWQLGGSKGLDVTAAKFLSPENLGPGWHIVAPK